MSSLLRKWRKDHSKAWTAMNQGDHGVVCIKGCSDVLDIQERSLVEEIVTTPSGKEKAARVVHWADYELALPWELCYLDFLGAGRITDGFKRNELNLGCFVREAGDEDKRQFFDEAQLLRIGVTRDREGNEIPVTQSEQVTAKTFGQMQKEVKHLVRVSIIVDFLGKHGVVELCSVLIPLNDEKKMIAFDLQGHKKTWMSYRESAQIQRIYGLVEEAHGKQELKKSYAEVSQMMQRGVSWVMLTLDFINTDNIGIRNTSAKLKSGKKGKKYRGVEWHEVVIMKKRHPVMRKIFAAGDTQVRAISREHLRRGHWAHYGPKYGKGLLFGKFAGRFWLQPSIVGDSEEGKIVKGYALKGKEESDES